MSEETELLRMSEESERRAALYAKWGKPVQFPVERAIELLGVEAHQDVAAFRYASMDAARAFAEENRVRHGWESYAAETPEGVVGVVFLPMPRRTSC